MAGTYITGGGTRRDGIPRDTHHSNTNQTGAGLREPRHLQQWSHSLPQGAPGLVWCSNPLPLLPAQPKGTSVGGGEAWQGRRDHFPPVQPVYATEEGGGETSSVVPRSPSTQSAE